MKKTETRQIAEMIQALTGKSLVIINYQAFEFVNMGLTKSRLEALKYMLEIEQGSEGRTK